MSDLAGLRSELEYRLTVGLRHVPGASKSEERHYNDGQAIGLRYAIERIDAALAREVRADEGLDVERLAKALVEVEESKLCGACLSDSCDAHETMPETSIGCGDAAAIAREYAALEGRTR